MNMDKEFINDLAEDIVSWNDFYMVGDSESERFSQNLQDMLLKHDISCHIIRNSQDFDFNEGDCLLAISSGNHDPFIVEIVETAISKGIKVYGISNDENPALSFLCGEFTIISENHERYFLEVLDEKLSGILKDDVYSLKGAAVSGPPSPVKKLIITVLLWGVIILIAYLLIRFLMGHVM